MKAMLDDFVILVRSIRILEMESMSIYGGVSSKIRGRGFGSFVESEFVIYFGKIQNSFRKLDQM